MVTLSFVLHRLGTSAEGAHLRARMQSACLLSDMEAFKAANPGCILGDFVRWYSPRDWVEEKVTDDDGTVKYVGWLTLLIMCQSQGWVKGEGDANGFCFKTVFLNLNYSYCISLLL